MRTIKAHPQEHTIWLTADLQIVPDEAIMILIRQFQTPQGFRTIKAHPQEPIYIMDTFNNIVD